jgi:hypothetical protein
VIPIEAVNQFHTLLYLACPSLPKLGVTFIVASYAMVRVKGAMLAHMIVNVDPNDSLADARAWFHIFFPKRGLGDVSGGIKSTKSIVSRMLMVSGNPKTGNDFPFIY